MELSPEAVLVFRVADWRSFVNASATAALSRDDFTLCNPKHT
jgi:hypothetical protein